MISIILLFIVFSFVIDDITNQIYAILILTVAASETVIGLSLLINFINLKHDIQITSI
jgi:NADH-quinone oxidoreductase subunit K